MRYRLFDQSLAELEERLMERLDQFDQCGTDPDQVKDVLVAVQQAQVQVYQDPD